MSLLTVIWSFSLLFPTIHATTATITGVPAYSSQRPCAHRCFYVGGSFDGGADLLANNIGCDVDPIENECICRPDIQPLAHSHLSSCVNDRCDSMTVDLNSAVSIYDDYCSSNGYTAESPAPTTTTDSDEPSDTPASSSSSSSSKQSSPSEAETETEPEPEPTAKDDQPTPPATESPKPSKPSEGGGGGGGDDDGLNTGELVGIIVGVLGFVATAIGSYFSYKALKTRRQAPAVTN